MFQAHPNLNFSNQRVNVSSVCPFFFLDYDSQDKIKVFVTVFCGPKDFLTLSLWLQPTCQNIIDQPQLTHPCYCVRKSSRTMGIVAGKFT